VGHKDERALEGQEVVLQPLHGFQVQVVGGFVQKQDVRALQQHTGQLGALPPAAGKQLDAPGEVAVLEAQTGEDGPGLVLRMVAVLRLEAGLPLGELVQLGLVLGLHGLLPLAPEVAPARQGRKHPAQQRLGEVRAGKFLGHIAHARALAHGHAAGLGLGAAGQDAQKRTLARAVGSGHGQAHAGQRLERQAGKEGLAPVGLLDVLNRDLGQTSLRKNRR